MIKNYFRVAIRNLIKNFGFSIINILGLATGIACSVLIFLFVNYELSYDKYNSNADNIYRMGVEAIIGSTEINQLGTPAKLARALYDEYPEVKAVCRFYASNTYNIQYENKKFIEDKVFLVDSSFFEIFTFPLIKGDPKLALSSPGQVVITESTARRYFGEEDPINKLIVVDSSLTLRVSGLIEDVPANSHFHFDMLISIISFEGIYNDPGWTSNNYQTYMLLHDNYPYKDLEAKFPALIDKYMFQTSGRSYDEWAIDGNYWKWYLQPLLSIHLNSDLSQEFEPNGNRSYVNIFLVVAIFILIIACINFMNLSSAKASKRALEVGVRKVVGSGKIQLLKQFLGESILISLIALAIGMAIVESLLPAYRNFIGREIFIPYLSNLKIIPSLLGLAILVGLISGSYPAFYLSSFKPILILKSKTGAKTKSAFFRNFLVVFQFTISISLIIGSIIVVKQVDFLQNKNLGFNKENIIIVENAGFLGNKIDPIKQVLLQNPDIYGVSATEGIPGIGISNIGFGAEEVDQPFTLMLTMCDVDYDDVLELEMIQGRFFSDEFPTDTAGIIINESALKLLGYENPIGKKMNDWAQPRGYFNVIGVVKDFRYESMHQEVRPLGIVHIDGHFRWGPRYIMIKHNSKKMSETLEFVKKTWSDFEPQIPPKYSIFTDTYDDLYRNEDQTKNLLLIFSFLSIFIACLGLLGLASFMAEQRTKEIGIRKVMGATTTQMITILSRDFTKWVLFANVIAIPLSWFVMNKWLRNFTHRVELSWWIFLMAGLITLIIALMTVSLQAIKTARTNPVNSLKYE